MKVLIVGSNSIHLSNFINGIKSKEVELSFMSEEKCDFWKEEMFLLNFRSKNPITLLNNYFKLKKILTKNSFDVVHIHQANRLAFFVTKVASKLRTNVVLTAWGSDVLLVPQRSFFHKYLVKQTLLNSNYITADAKVMIDAMLRLEPNTSKYKHLQYGIEPVSAGIKEKIIFSNRLHKDFYNIDKIIVNFEKFQKSNPEWKLVIAGTGTETENLKKLVERLGIMTSVSFVGWLSSEENNSWYSKSQIYCSIPSSDGTSVSVLESMSAGCLPILSDIPVSHEWVKNGENGVIYSDERNPFEAAIEIDFEKAKILNQNLIEKKALKESCVNEFYDIYTNIRR